MVAISPNFNPLDNRPGMPWPEALGKAIREAQWKSGRLRISKPPVWTWNAGWSPNSSPFKLAHQIRCPVQLVYGTMEGERYRAQADEFATLVPTPKTRAWRTGGHGLLNVPEALEDAAEWLKQQLLRPEVA